MSTKDASSSDDEIPVELIDYSRMGPFEQTVEKIAQFIRSAVAEWNDIQSKARESSVALSSSSSPAAHQSQKKQTSASSSSSSDCWFIRELHFTGSSALAGIDDFERRLHGTTAADAARHHRPSGNSNDGDDQPGSVRLIASLHVFDNLNNNSNNNNNLHHHRHDDSSSRHPIAGLFGVPAFLYLRPAARIPNLAPQMTSTLLSLGTCAIDELGRDATAALGGLPSGRNVPVFAPLAKRDSMTFQGMGKFRSTTTQTKSIFHSPSSNNREEEGGGGEYVMATATTTKSFSSSSSAAPAIVVGKIPVVLPYLPSSQQSGGHADRHNHNDDDEDDDFSVGGGGGAARSDENVKQGAASAASDNTNSGLVICTNQYSQNINVGDRAFAGLGFLDGTVDAFVQSVGRQCRFLRARASDVGMVLLASSSSSAGDSSSSNTKKGKRSDTSTNTTTSTTALNRNNLEGTLWADTTRIYQCPVPNRQRWTHGVLGSWDSQANGHDRALAAVLLGFDGNSWHQLAGCPSAAMGTTENPLESIHVEMSWNFLRVDSMSIADNESISWFDDVVDGLFGAALKSAEASLSSASASSRGASATTSANRWKAGGSGGGGGASAAALGPPTTINLSARLRHRSEYSSRIEAAFDQFLRDAANVMSGPLDSIRRQHVVEQFKEKARNSGKGVVDSIKGVFSDEQNEQQVTTTTAGTTTQSSSSSASSSQIATGGATNNNRRGGSNNNNNNNNNSGGGGIKSAIGGFFSALLNAGTTAASAVAHSAADTIKRAHPDEFIISRRSTLAAHCNNILAALRRNTTSSSNNEYPGARHQQQQQQQTTKKRSPQQHRQGFVVSRPDGATLASLRASDLRRQIPPGSVLSRFAAECRNMRHLDEVKELWVTLIDILKEILTGAGGRNQFFEEYDAVGALQVAEESWAVDSAKRQEKSNKKRQQATGGEKGETKNTKAKTKGEETKEDRQEKEDEDPYEGDGLTQSSSRAGVLLRSLLVDFDADAGVDCVADVFHQKMQALALCADAIRLGHVAGRRAASPVLVESPLKMKGSSRASTKTSDSDAAADDAFPAFSDEKIFAPLDRRFVTPITFGDRGALPDEEVEISAAAAQEVEAQNSAAYHKKDHDNTNNNNNNNKSHSAADEESATSTGHASRILLRDMSDFLRVNRNRKTPVCLADFLAWFSPADVKRNVVVASIGEEEMKLARREEENAAKLGSLPLGYLFLSTRMRAQGNAWRDSWLMASKMYSALKKSRDDDDDDGGGGQRKLSDAAPRQNGNDDNDDDCQQQTKTPQKQKADNNNSDVLEDDDPLQEALEIFKWLRQRPMAELFYVIIKAQVAACGFQLVQHPVYATLEYSSASAQSTSSSSPLSSIAADIMTRMSQTFPSWHDFCECLQSSDSAASSTTANSNSQEEEEATGDANNSNNSNNNEDDKEEAIFDSVGPEVEHRFTQLFRPAVTELAKAEYLVCAAISVCDAVAPFGSNDTGDLLSVAHSVAASVVRHIQKTDPRFFFRSSNQQQQQQHESLERPADWTSAIFTGDTSNRLCGAVPMDPSLFFRSSMCAAWMDQERGSFEATDPSDPSNSRKRAHPPAKKTRRPIAKQYRVYGFTQRVMSASSSSQKNQLPGTFQRLVTTVDSGAGNATMATFTSQVMV